MPCTLSVQLSSMCQPAEPKDTWPLCGIAVYEAQAALRSARAGTGKNARYGFVLSQHYAAAMSAIRTGKPLSSILSSASSDAASTAETSSAPSTRQLKTTAPGADPAVPSAPTWAEQMQQILHVDGSPCWPPRWAQVHTDGQRRADQLVQTAMHLPKPSNSKATRKRDWVYVQQHEQHSQRCEELATKVQRSKRSTDPATKAAGIRIHSVVAAQSEKCRDLNVAAHELEAALHVLHGGDHSSGLKARELERFQHEVWPPHVWHELARHTCALCGTPGLMPLHNACDCLSDVSDPLVQ